MRSAEFGFFGSVVYTRVHTRGAVDCLLRAAVLTLAICRGDLADQLLNGWHYRLFQVSVLCLARRLPRCRACHTHRIAENPMHREHANLPGERA